jgi:hypothetical protein
MVLKLPGAKLGEGLIEGIGAKLRKRTEPKLSESIGAN